MPTNTRLVSVVIPCFNAAEFVASAVGSALATAVDVEVIVVDDGSTDGTADMLRVRYPTVRVFQAGGVGPAGARNVGIDQATSQYVAFLDSDDLWLPGKLSRQLAFMKETGAAFSFTAFRRISQDGATVGRLINVPPRLGYSQLLKNTAIATSTVIVDRNVAGELRMTRTYYDDLVMWLELMKRGVTAHGLDVDLMRYRVVAQSISRSKSNSARQVWNTYRNVEKLNPLAAAWYFAHYAGRGWLKYRRF